MASVTLARRNFVALAAATVIPSAALAAATMCVEPDAKLIELGRKFQAAMANEMAAREEANRLSKIWRARLNELHPDREETLEIKEIRRIEAELSVAIGHDAAYTAWDMQHKAASAIAKAIETTPATTIAGLAVKAAVVWWQAESWCSDPDGGVCWDEARIAILLESMLSAAGLPVPEDLAAIAEQERDLL
jgi:hypothetical protein